MTFKKILALLVLASVPSFTPSFAHGQAISQTGGSISGSITDPSGAVIPGAMIVIANPATGYTHTLTSDKAGFYSLGPLNPGSYTISVSAANFEGLKATTVVRVGTVTSGSEKLTIGKGSETIQVTAGELQINTEQVGVAGIVTKEQIDTLPINGRNILDIAQVQPGVILQSGQSFDPTKTGYSAVSVNGQNGRSTRVLVDGQDVSDETVGTVLFNIPEGAIGEFQLNRSTQDVSGSVTSTGQVLLATQSGTNRYHGTAFYNFQDAREGFANVNGAYAPFQRNQFGGYIGGPILKDKLFFFGGGERIKQIDSSPVGTSTFFSASQTKTAPGIYDLYPTTPDPFRDTFVIGRLDYNAPKGIHMFARGTYSNNASFGAEGQTPYALFENQDNVPAFVGGADFTTGKFTHSLRYGHLKFINNIQAGANSLGSSVYNPSAILGVPFELIGALYAGSGNEDAPQKTYQLSKSFRYDGTWTKGAHSIKYGGEATRITGGGFAAFYSTFLADVSTNTKFLLPTCATADPVGGLDPQATTCSGDPLYGYKPVEYVFGNGNGSFSERPAFGLPGGGQFSWRIASYVGDTWKVTPNFTAVFGLRWSVDTDRANQDLPTVTCGEVDPSLQFAGCDSTTPDTPLFDFFGPGLGLGKKTHQPYANFGPQAGFVYSPGSHRMSVRGGMGIYYENNLFNNGSNARAENTQAEFPGFAYGINNYTQTSLTLPGFVSGFHGVTSSGTPCNVGTVTSDPGCISFPTIYGMSVADATLLLSKLDTQYKTASAVPQPNGSFIGNGDGLQAISAYGGPYKTPYAIQINGGVQYELKRGVILNVDYVHNSTLKVPLTVDTNHVGAARFLNTTAAQNAIAGVLAECGATTIAATYLPGGCPGGSGVGADGKPNDTATIADYANAGLDSGAAYLSGYAASAFGLTPNTGAAFGGANPNVGVGGFILPVGKSGYDALQVVLQEQKAHPMKGIVNSNMQISYNLSRAVSNSKGGSNQFFAGSGAYNNDDVNQYIGRNDLDHSNQISFATSATVKYGLQIGVVGHFFSAPASTLTLGSVQGTGQIFLTDVDGDGTTGDLLPGTGIGDYEHRIKGKGLAATINNYNATQAGTLTPAGQALVAAGLFTQGDLVALGATKQPLAPAPLNPLKNAATRDFDASFKYPISFKKFREGLVLTPGVTMYNVANMSNFGGFGSLSDTTNTGDALKGYLNGPNTSDVLETARVNRGSGNGTFDAGGPRTTEFSLKLDF